MCISVFVYFHICVFSYLCIFIFVYFSICVFGHLWSLSSSPPTSNLDTWSSGESDPLDTWEKENLSEINPNKNLFHVCLHPWRWGVARSEPCEHSQASRQLRVEGARQRVADLQFLFLWKVTVRVQDTCQGIAINSNEWKITFENLSESSLESSRLFFQLHDPEFEPCLLASLKKCLHITYY